MKLGEILQRILTEYPYEKEEQINKPFKGDNLASFMRNEATQKLKDLLKDLDYNLADYEAKFSPGISRWGSGAWGGIRYKNEGITTSFENGFYIVYHLINDRKTVYLTLNQGFNAIPGNKVKTSSDRANILKKKLNFIPEGFKTEIEFDDDNYRLVVAGNIIAKRYDFNDLSDENLLISDLKVLLGIYNDIIPVYKELFIDNSENSSDKLKRNDVRVWSIYPGDSSERPYVWPKFRDNGYIGMGFLNERDYNEFESIDDLKKELKKAYPKRFENTNPQSVASMILDFRDNIKVGDYLVAPGGYYNVLGIGTVISEYIGPRNPDNSHIDDEYLHLRKVAWKNLEENEFDDYKSKNSYFFQQKTLSDLPTDKWTEILLKYCENKSEFLKKLFNDFNESYLKTDKGKEHLEFYDNEKSDVNENFKAIENDPNIINQQENPVLDYLLPLKRRSVSPAGFKTFTAFEYTLDDYPKLTLSIFNLIKDVIDEKDPVTQYKIIKEFQNSNFSTGSQSGVISPVLHALDPYFLIVNSKTIDSIKFLSKIIGIEYKLNTQLTDYLSTNNILKKAINDLKAYIPEFEDFHVFDAFCHWLCEPKLANYARGRPLSINYLRESDTQDFKLKYTILEDSEEIKEAQNKFSDILFNAADEVISTDLHWSNELGILISSKDLKSFNRYLNGFGIHKPDATSQNAIICEINIPKSGINTNIAGAFAKDDEENIHVIHRGIFGNLSKKDFKEKYTGTLAKIKDGEIVSEVVLIGNLNDPNLLGNIRKLVYEVAEMKGVLKVPNINIKNPLETIFQKLPLAKKNDEKPKNHEVGRAFLDVKDAILKIGNSIHPEKDYNSIAYYQAYGNWYKQPYVYIEDTAHKDKFGHWDQHYVGFWFTEDLEGVYISLQQSGNYAKNLLSSKLGHYTEEDLQDYLNDHATEIKNQLKEFISLNDYLEESNLTAFSDKIIYGKYYDKNSIPSNDQIISDFKELLNLYSILKPDDIIEINNDISFFKFLSQEGYLFDNNLVENFLLSLKVKPFVILTGNSGTGKTKIAQLFAQYLSRYNSAKYEIVPVGANWTEHRHIIGFYNVITGNYEKTQSLNLILLALDNWEKYAYISHPHFLILDEMNLSHVERYFSDFLSVMESQDEMPLHDKDDGGVPGKLELPQNLFVIGTVNVDETTYMFSPKVLDRANTIEFLTHSPLEYMKNGFENIKPLGDIAYLQNPLSEIEPLSDIENNIRNSSMDYLKDLMQHIRTKDGNSFWDIISFEIDEIYNELKKAGFDFGFRAVNEIMRFMYVAWKYEGMPESWDNWERYFDAQIKQKMLPKLHGSQRTLQATLKSLFEICFGNEIEKDPRSISYDRIQESAKYKTAAFKLKEMDKILYEQRYTSFIT